MNKCIKVKTNKYSFRNAPPYSANKCKSIKKKGNDGKIYLSKPDKNKTYKWVAINKTKTLKNKATKEDLQTLVKKYNVTKSGSNEEVADRLVRLRGHFIKNKMDRKIIEQFLKKTTPSTQRWGFLPVKGVN
jgi:ribosomal protein S20